MAIRGGPPRGPKPPATTGPRATKKAARTQEPEAIAHEIEDGYERSSGRSPAASAKHAAGSRAVLQQALETVERELSKLETELARILNAVASHGASAEQLKQQRAELDRLRKALDAARRRLNKGRRALKELDQGLERFEEPDLAELERDIADLERASTEWGRALGAFELIGDLAADEGAARRVPLQGGERTKAMAFAERSNPTTAIADLAASALEMIDGKEPIETESGALGRGLSPEQKLARMIAPSAEELSDET